jgi:hypothetical protein
MLTFVEMARSNDMSDNFVNKDLQTDVKRWVRIGVNDPFFAKAEDFRRRYRLNINCLKNYCRLATGYRGIPVVVMQNPCSNHTKGFHDMFTENSALALLRNLFNEINLDIEHDIPVIDICPMISDEWAQSMTESGQSREVQQAIYDAYELTAQYLEALQPSTVVVLQCATSSCAASKHPFLGRVVHPLAQSLCSSMDEATQCRYRVVRVLNHHVCMVPGFHPSRINRDIDPSRKNSLTAKLRRILSNVYSPYSQWINRSVSAEWVEYL